MKRAIAILAALAACSPPDQAPRWRAAGSPAPRDGGTLRFATKDQVSTLDPTREYDEVSGTIVHALVDTLVGYAPDSTALVPHLAARWDVSPDGLTYTFWLRDGIAFADGTPIRAADFAFALERARTTADSPFGPFLANVTAVDARGDGELAITLAGPDASFLYVLAMTFTAPQRPDPALASGPFVLASWDRGVRVVLRKNPRYWDASHVHLDGIEMLENVPRDTQFLMFERGELDAIDRLSAPDYLWIRAQAAWQPYLHAHATLSATGSRLDCRKKPFDDRRVRVALNYALDKDHSVRLLQGAGVPAHGILPPGVAGRDDDLAPYPHDPAKARALLAEAGYPAGFDVDYLIMNDDEAERLAGSLQHDLAEVGVRVHIVEMTFAAYAQALVAPDGPAFAKIGWTGDYPDASNFLDASFHSRAIAAGTNYASYANPTLDRVLDDARGERDPARRAALYRRAERILFDDAPWLWDYHEEITEVTQPYVQGYTPHPVWLRDYTHAWLDLGPGGERIAR